MIKPQYSIHYILKNWHIILFPLGVFHISVKIFALILFAYVYSALSDVRRTVRDVKMAILEALSNNASVVPSLQIGMIGSLVAMLQHVRPNPAKSKCVSYYVKYTSTIFTSIRPENTNTQSIGTLMI